MSCNQGTHEIADHDSSKSVLQTAPFLLLENSVIAQMTAVVVIVHSESYVSVINVER